MEKDILDIGEVAARSGLPVSTLRFYEEKGLIKSIGRQGLHRIFDSTILERLALIVLGRHSGFSLEEIAAMANDPQIDRAQLLAKADQLDQTIKELTAVRDGLRHVAECPASLHFECLRFQTLIRISIKSQRIRKKSRSKPSIPFI